MEILGPGAVPARRTRPARCCRRGSSSMYRGAAHPHVRRRHQRGAARPHRPVRPRHAAVAPRYEDDDSDGLLLQRRAAGPSSDLADADPRGRALTHERLQRARGRRASASTASLWAAARRRRPARHRAARGARRRGLGFLEVALVLEQIGAHGRAGPVLRDARARRAADRASSAPTRSRRAGCRASPTATRSSPPRWSSRSATRSTPSTTADAATATAGCSTASRTACPPGSIATRVARAGATADGAVSCVVDPTAAGVTLERQDTTTAARPRRASTLRASRRGDVLGDAGEGADIVAWIVERADGGAVRRSRSASARRRCA